MASLFCLLETKDEQTKANGALPGRSVTPHTPTRMAACVVCAASITRRALFLNSPPFPSSLMAALASALLPAMTLSYFETSLSRLAPPLRFSVPPFCRRPHRGMTCRRHIQAGWPSCWRDVGDRISLQQTMAVMRVDSVKPLFWRPVERAALANLNKCTLGRKKRGKFFGSLVLSAASCSIDSHARRMPLCIPGKRNFGLSNFQFPPL